ncbi:MAG: hypothetical protein GY768_24925 [Planctomycetaceae bacterium]|nr:hypothetical protein [Planctomycetaceae bacterium]
MNRFLLFLTSMLSFVSIGQTADVILNEYNAVSTTKILDGGEGEDSQLGLVLGNGGNWFELLVVRDHVDMRGWALDWVEDEEVGNDETAAGRITLSEDTIWSDLRSGSIITIVETADGGDILIDTQTDLSYDPLNGDWWINVVTQTEQAKGTSALISTVTNDGEPGDFSVGKDDWTLTILNADGNTIFGPAGEGAESWAGGKVNSEEAGSLEGPIQTDGQPLTIAAWQAITPSSEFYDDTGTTSFGAANVDFNTETNEFTTIQDLSVLRNPVLGIFAPGDFNEDGLLTADDLDQLSLAVRDNSINSRYDLDANGTINNDDRLFWVSEIRHTWLGDSNLDGEFNSSDFVYVFSIGQYEDGIDGNSNWESGDWNGDGEFDSSDFVASFADGGFENGPRSTVQAVPEPTSFGLVTVSLVIGLGLAHRRRKSLT